MKRSELVFTLVLVPLDILALIDAGISAFYLRTHPFFTTLRPIIFDLRLDQFLKVIFPIIILWIVIYAVAGLYTTKRTSIASEMSRVILASSSAMALIFAITFFSRTLFESRFIAVAAWGLAIVYVCITRLVVRGLQRSLLKLGIGVHHIVVIGNNSTAEALIKEFKQKKHLGFQVVGNYKEFDKRVAGRIQELKHQNKLDEVVLADPQANKQTTMDLIALTDAEHLGFRYSADLFSAAVGRFVNHTYAGIPVIEVQKTPLDGWGAIYKRLFDIVVATLFIIVTLPLMLITAIAIKLDSRGPVFFTHVDSRNRSLRIGQSGKPFHYFKFRSMIPDTHAMRYNELAHQDIRKGSPMVKIKNDPRVTRVGKFIRAWSIDELPEFFLVLTGKMSLVGPRPHLPEEVDNYKPAYRKVLTIKPGITGMAQISGRADLNFEDEVRLDVYYIEHWSPWLDFYILLKTPLIVLFRKEKGAY